MFDNIEPYLYVNSLRMCGVDQSYFGKNVAGTLLVAIVTKTKKKASDQQTKFSFQIPGKNAIDMMIAISPLLKISDKIRDLFIDVMHKAIYNR